MGEITTIDTIDICPSSYVHADALLVSLKQALASSNRELTSKCLERLETAFCAADTVTQYKILTEAIQFQCYDICPLLRTALVENPSALVRHEAAFGLGLLGGSKEVELLTQSMLHDDHLMVRHEAAIALAVVCGPDSEGALSDVITGDEVSVAESAEFARRELALRTSRTKL